MTNNEEIGGQIIDDCSTTALWMQLKGTNKKPAFLSGKRVLYVLALLGDDGLKFITYPKIPPHLEDSVGTYTLNQWIILS